MKLSNNFISRDKQGEADRILKHNEHLLIPEEEGEQLQVSVGVHTKAPLRIGLSGW